MKALYGIILLGGLAIAGIAGSIGHSAANSGNLDPSMDLYYDLVTWSSSFAIVVGLATFFAGAVMFARAK